MRILVGGMTAVLLSLGFVAISPAGESPKYTHRYKFHPGETIRWEVEHRSMVRATVSRSTQSTETLSNSVNSWRVTDVQPDGTATLPGSISGAGASLLGLFSKTKRCCSSATAAS